MTIHQILIVTGTHGNEINPIWAVDQFIRREKNDEKDIEYKFILGNPLAYEKGSRYIDSDLNRSFNVINNISNGSNNNYEIGRANFLVEQFGINGYEPCQIAIDLHTTTSNMGTCIVMYGRRRKDFCLAALLQNKFGLPIYLHENDQKQKGFLVEAWPCGLVIEIGAVAQNFYDPKIINRFFIILSSLKNEINKLRNKVISMPNELIIHVHQGSIDYPRTANGDIGAIIHPERINQDWKPIRKGDPLFLDNEGEVVSYKGGDIVCPVFIGEVAYKEKKIAMSFTKKQVILTEKEWLEEFLNS